MGKERKSRGFITIPSLHIRRHDVRLTLAGGPPIEATRLPFLEKLTHARGRFRGFPTESLLGTSHWSLLPAGQSTALHSVRKS